MERATKRNVQACCDGHVEKLKDTQFVFVDWCRLYLHALYTNKIALNIFRKQTTRASVEQKKKKDMHIYNNNSRNNNNKEKNNNKKTKMKQKKKERKPTQTRRKEKKQKTEVDVQKEEEDENRSRQYPSAYWKGKNGMAHSNLRAVSYGMYRIRTQELSLIILQPWNKFGRA